MEVFEKEGAIGAPSDLGPARGCGIAQIIKEAKQSSNEKEMQTKKCKGRKTGKYIDR